MILNLEVTGVSSSGIFSRGKIFTKGEYQKNSHGKYYPECSTRLVLDMTINIHGLDLTMNIANIKTLENTLSMQYIHLNKYCLLLLIFCVWCSYYWCWAILRWGSPYFTGCASSSHGCGCNARTWLGFHLCPSSSLPSLSSSSLFYSWQIKSKRYSSQTNSFPTDGRSTGSVL